LPAQVTVVTVTGPWTEGAYATIPTPSLIKAYEQAAAEGAADRGPARLIAGHGSMLVAWRERMLNGHGNLARNAATRASFADLVTFIYPTRLPSEARW